MKSKLSILLPGLAIVMLTIVWMQGGRSVPTWVVDHGGVEVIRRTTAQPWLRDRYIVRVPMDSLLMPVTHKVGERVKAGDPLLALYPFQRPVTPEVRAATATSASDARLDSDAARARVEHAREEYERLSNDFATGRGDALALDAAARGLKDALLQLRSAEFAIDVSRYALDVVNALDDRQESSSPFVLRAAVNGVVTGRHASGDEIVLAGQPLLEIADPETLELHACITQTESVEIGIGTPVWLTRGELQLEGRIRRIVPAISQELKCAGIEADIRAIIDPVSFDSRWKRFKGNEPVQVTFQAWSNANVLRLPVESIYQQEDRSMVYVLREGRAYGTPVTLGRAGENFVEVRAGVRAGDVVVLSPSEVTDGMRIRQ